MSKDINNSEMTHNVTEAILADITSLSEYIIRLKGLGIAVPTEVMVKGLNDIKTKYASKTTS